MSSSAHRNYISVNNCKTRCNLKFALNCRDEQFDMNYMISDGKYFVPKHENIIRIMTLFDTIIAYKCRSHKIVMMQYPILLVYCGIQFIYQEFAQKYMSDEYQKYEDAAENEEYKQYKEAIRNAINELEGKPSQTNKKNKSEEDFDEDIVSEIETSTKYKKKGNKTLDITVMFILIDIIKKMSPDKYVNRVMIKEVIDIKSEMINLLKKCMTTATHKTNNFTQNNNESAIAAEKVKNSNSRSVNVDSNKGKVTYKNIAADPNNKK